MEAHISPPQPILLPLAFGLKFLKSSEAQTLPVSDLLTVDLGPTEVVHENKYLF